MKVAELKLALSSLPDHFGVNIEVAVCNKKARETAANLTEDGKVRTVEQGIDRLKSYLSPYGTSNGPRVSGSVTLVAYAEDGV